MDRDARASGTDSGWGLALLGAVLDIIWTVVAGGSDRRDSDDARDSISDADTSSTSRGAFAGEEMMGDAYTAYGREPVGAGKNGEPVGTYSGAPIIHY
ncbi:hypothetical protein [Aromatoleum bremense]|uniref:hypothetical protein n=1 Tax=Aromatoleum bremense TaxID=76115 RepID=UPI00145DACE8|nr:hypothetical protein [Aromatoleum bremense]QTQ30100.1 Uncharacterized protein pbN1_01070 [Aromatoleum bremense]